MKAGLTSQQVPPEGSPEPILDVFCFLSRFYYAACISKQKCEGQKSRIVLPGERGFVSSSESGADTDGGDSSVVIRDADPFLDRPDAVCLCRELPICVATTPFSSIEPTPFDIAKWERQVFHLAIFVPLGISSSCIFVLVIMAYFVGRHKRRRYFLTYYTFYLTFSFLPSFLPSFSLSLSFLSIPSFFPSLLFFFLSFLSILGSGPKRTMTCRMINYFWIPVVLNSFLSFPSPPP